MYGLFPIFMHVIEKRVLDERLLSLHVGRDEAYMVKSLQFVDGGTIWTVVVDAVLTGKALEDELLGLAAQFSASFSSVPHIFSRVVKEEGRLAGFLRRVVCG